MYIYIERERDYIRDKVQTQESKISGSFIKVHVCVYINTVLTAVFVPIHR